MDAVRVLILSLLVVAAIAAPQYHGGGGGGGGGYGGHGYDDKHEERDYKLSYKIKDDKHYNYQSRHEEKKGKVVTGHYSVVEPTGEERIVKYIADKHGFRAHVEKHGGHYGGGGSRGGGGGGHY